jgi:hypothetical protein
VDDTSRNRQQLVNNAIYLFTIQSTNELYQITK